MDEEAVKCSTDCVYFLASPLTCKKGVNCEYRHSEAARLHPRDCRYWLGGNCLNAKCSFRHPPLDGRPASSAHVSSAPSKAATATSASAVPANKSGTPCYFFSRGYCSKGNRCAFLHGSLVTPAQPAAAHKPPEVSTSQGLEIKGKSRNAMEVNGSSIQRLPEASISKRLEIKDKPMIVVNGLFTQTSMSKLEVGTTAPALPSNVFIRAQNMYPAKNDAVLLCESSSKASNVQIQTLKLFNSCDSNDGGHSVQAPSNSLSNFPGSYCREQCKEQWQQQRKCVEERCVKMVRSAETKQLLQGGRMQEGTLRETLSKDVNQGFGEDTLEVNKQLPYLNSVVCSPRRTFCDGDALDFEQGGSELCGIPLSPEFESYYRPEQLSRFDCQRSFENSWERDHNPPYLARRDRQKYRDLRDYLSKRRISDQDHFLDYDGHSDAFEDRELSDERDWVDSIEAAPSEIEQETSWRKFKRAVRKRVQSPNHEYGWDAETEISLGSSPLMYSATYFPRSNHYVSNGGWYTSKKSRCYLELHQGRSLQTRLGSRVNVADDFQAGDEFYSGSSSSYVACPSIKSQILCASSSNSSQVVEVLNDFEGPKPLSVLLQTKRRGK